MWAEVEACFSAQRARLCTAGIPLAARLEPAPGLLCAYAEGAVRLALPTLDDPEGTLRATMIGALMGARPAEVAWLFEALLPRLVGHEIGHALRDEAGLLGEDVLVEEQVADRLGALLSREVVSAADRRRARALLGEASARLGGLAEAAALHRHAREAKARLGLEASIEGASLLRATLQRDYSRDVATYLRVFVSWAFLDLTLDLDDNLDAFRRDHLSA